MGLKILHNANSRVCADMVQISMRKTHWIKSPPRIVVWDGRFVSSPQHLAYAGHFYSTIYSPTPYAIGGWNEFRTKCFHTPEKSYQIAM